jgi:hypothetical protein
MVRLARTVFLAIAVTTLFLGHGAKEAWACPNCKEAVSLDAGEVSQMSSGYNWSVVFMLVVPFSMLGTGAFMVRRGVQQGTLPEM